MDKLTVRDLAARDKRVFLRVDFNVPLEDGKVTDDSRIRASLPTIVHLLSQGARVVIASHLGRPDGKVQDGLRLRPVGERLSLLLRRNVPVTGDALGPGTEDAVKRIRPGEALMLENLRFHAEEEKNDPAFAATLASYADVYVNDAFGTAHRAHASTVGVPSILPAYAGLLMEREIRALSALVDDPEHPYAAVVGGAKVSGKLQVLDNLLTKVDTLILGGGMANTFLLAQGKSVGKSLAEHDMLDEARRLLAKAEKHSVRVVLPVDVIVAKEVTRGTEYKTLSAEKIPASWHIVDVGRQTLDLIEEALRDVRTVVWNGPIGVFEIPVFGAGTRHVARILAEKAGAGATVVVGGGDSVAAVQQQGLAGQMTHISTGGGASLEFLEGKELPGIAVLLDRSAQVAEPEPEPEPVEVSDVVPIPFLKPLIEPEREPVRLVSVSAGTSVAASATPAGGSAGAIATSAGTAAAPRGVVAQLPRAGATPVARKAPAPAPARPTAPPRPAATKAAPKPVVRPAAPKSKPAPARPAARKATPARKPAQPAKPRPTGARRPAAAKTRQPVRSAKPAKRTPPKAAPPKAAPKKSVARKPTAAARKPAAKKAAPTWKATTAKKAAPTWKATTAKKAAPKKAATSKKATVAKKPAVTKSTSARKVPSKSAARKPAPKKPVARKPAARKPAPRKTRR